MKQTIILLLFLGSLGYFIAHGGNLGDQKIRPRDMSNSTAGHAGGIPVLVLYSDEKQAWLEAVHDRFTRAHPEIHVTLKPMTLFQSVYAILDGVEKPTVWMPTDTTVMNLLAHMWEEKHGEPIFASKGHDRPVEVMRSPLVWLTWDHVADEFLTGGMAGIGGIGRPWVDIGCWGVPRGTRVTTARVTAGNGSVLGPKFRHSNPTVSSSGLQALYLMVYEYLNRPAEVRNVDLHGDLITWFERCQKRIPEFAESTDKLGRSMLQFGPDRAGVIVTYERLALKLLQSLRGQPGHSPVLYYPSHTLSTGHPAAIPYPERLAPDVLKAAHTWIQFLRSREIQETLVQHGWRPTHPGISLRWAGDSSNPFLELGRFGVRIDIPAPVAAPSGAVARQLMRAWRRAAGR